MALVHSKNIILDDIIDMLKRYKSNVRNKALGIVGKSYGIRIRRKPRKIPVGWRRGLPRLGFRKPRMGISRMVLKSLLK